MEVTRPEIYPKTFTAFRKNVAAFHGDPPGIGDYASVEGAESQDVTATMGIEDKEAVRST